MKIKTWKESLVGARFEWALSLRLVGVVGAILMTTLYCFGIESSAFFTSISALPNSTVQMTYVGPGGHSYGLLAGTNLAYGGGTWTALTNGVFATSNAFTDVHATNYAHRFYILVVH